MDVELFKENFKKYFFYGMDNQSDVIDYIILREADKMLKTDMSKIETDKYKVEYTLEQIYKLVVQLYRFVQMNEPAEKQTYFYHQIGPNTIEVEQLVQTRMNELYHRDIITGGIKDCENSAIYITGGDYYHRQYPGRDYYNNLKENPNNKWIVEGAVPILEELSQLELENKEQYYALFLDAKYNRTINAQEQLQREQEYLENLQAPNNLQDRIEHLARVRAILPKQIEEIKTVFSKFMNSINLPKQDILANLGIEVTQEMHEYIRQKCSSYDTVSTLKQEATNHTYQERLKKKIEEIKAKNLEEIR